MLMDDLRLYGRGDRELDRKVRNKCEADLIYYAILDTMIGEYGIATAKRISDIDPDALCIARNQMAQLASDHDPSRTDHDLLRFDPEGRVEGFYNPETGGYDGTMTPAARMEFVRGSFLNCEALRAMVSTSLASSAAYRGKEMSDEEFEALVEDHIQNKVLNAADPDSPLSRVLAVAGSFDATMGFAGGPAGDYWAMNMPAERIIRDEADARETMDRNRAWQAAGSAANASPGRLSLQPGDKVMDLDEDGRPSVVRGLKLSPLMPEFRILRDMGLGDPLGLYQDARGHAMSRGRDETDRMNSVLMFDAQKRALVLAPDPAKGYFEAYLPMDAGAEYADRTGLVFGPTEYAQGQAYQTQRTVSTIGFDDETGGQGGIVTGDARTYVVDQEVYDNAGQNRSMRSIQAWRMGAMLDGISQRSLNAKDYETIKKIMASGLPNGTLFGDVGRDGESAVAANEDAYFGYVRHVCESAHRRMRSHEFSIHFDEQQGRYADKDGLVPLLYMTGEHTDDHNRARANPSKYFAFYPFMNYTPANLDVSPLAGDIAPAAYNTYTITDEARRRGTDPRMNDPARNPYAHMTRIDAEMAGQMRAMHDSYMAGPARGMMRAGIRLAKIRRPVGDTGLDDLSRFINPDGSVDAALVTKVLVDDMNVTKNTMRQEFLAPGSAVHMKGIFDRFMERNGGERVGDAAALFYSSARTRQPKPGRPRVTNAAEFGAALSEELDKCLNFELKAAYGQDINSYTAMRHIYRAYLDQFAEACVRDVVRGSANSSVRDALPDMSEMPAAFDNDALEAARDGILGRMSDRSDPTLLQALKDLYGTGEFERDGYVDPDMPQRVVLKANMCRYSSQQFLYQDYSDLLELLAYTDKAGYEADTGKPTAAVLAGLATEKPVAVQLYVPDAYGVNVEADYDRLDLQDAMDGDDDGDYHDYGDDGSDAGGSGVSARASVSDDKLWFATVFSDPEDGKRTLAWLDADYSGEPVTAAENWAADPRVEHAVFEAKHPLQCAALRRCGEALSRSERQFDPARLSISRQGVITYESPDGSMPFRLGPVLDEEAYIRPVLAPCGPDDPEGSDVRVPALNEHGYPVRDANGTVKLRQARLKPLEGYYVGADGRLENPVSFGPLDRKSALAPEDQDATVNNRLYGLSGSYVPYDGYDHKNRSIIDRMSVASYQMLVMENVDRALSLHVAARNSDGKDGIARSVFYTNVGPGTLQKCYQTGTYLLEGKAKMAMSGKLLANYMDADKFFADIYSRHSSEDTREFNMCDNVAAMTLAQIDADRSRVVFQTIETDQNIGLYNQAVNLHQCEARDGGRLDVKSMQDTDSKGARVALFQYNPVFDSVVSGTAKKLGNVVYLTDAVRYDRFTGDIQVDPDVSAEIGAGGRPNCRMPWISTGVRDIFSGDVTNIVPHSGAQAFDRQQLSAVGSLKGLNIVPGLSFAMVGLGYNMEDGYIVSDRAAYRLGHFESADRYVPLQLHDKIGDTESGNKGVTARIQDTSIGRGMDDAAAEDEFLARYLYDYLQSEGMNHGGANGGGRTGAFWAAVQKGVDTYIGHGQPVGIREALLGKMCDGGGTVGQKLDSLREHALGKGSRKRGTARKMDALREDIYQALKPDLVDIGRYLLAGGVEPFRGAYGIEHACWQLFRDNPDLDVAVTNVCVCTRSNPSILMNIGEACDRDRAGLEAAGDVDRDKWLAEHGESVLIMRDENGEKKPVMGAKGTFSMYVDSHTADDKNKNYNEEARSPKAGRRLAAQENYAIQAERCFEHFYAFMTANDPAMPDNVAKLNRRMAMNGFLFDLGTENLQSRRLVDAIGGSRLEEQPGSGGAVYRGSDAPWNAFVDMKELAKSITGQVPEGTSQEDIGKAVAAMCENQDFSKLLNLGRGVQDMQGSPKSVDDKLRHMFVSVFGRDGGAFMLLPDGLEGANAAADIGLTKTVRDIDESTGRSYTRRVPDRVEFVAGVEMPDGTQRSSAPLFMSSKEISNPDAELVTAPVDSRAQFKMFKTVLAAAVADRLHEMDLVAEGPGRSRVAMLSDEAHSEAVQSLREAFLKGYSKFPSEKSLSLDNMEGWTKKNLYYLSVRDSMTSVWSGDPTVGIDEIGMTFESAKSMGILKPKAGKTADELAKIPDTYEFMSERYEPLGDDDIVIVNRSPGQTTGCLRAFHPKIVKGEGGGIRVNPACATIFDGDFDGDTVGVGDPFAPMGLEVGSDDYRSLSEAAKQELAARMSMRGNMVHEADYCEVTAGDGSKIADVHPLFIAGNADYATARHNMSREVLDRRGSIAPACGYDVDRELDAITCMANMLYELRNSAYDKMNSAEGRIGAHAADRIVEARAEQIGSLRSYFDKMDMSDGTAKDRESAGEWRTMAEEFDKLADGFRAEGRGAHGATLDGVIALEEKVFGRFRDVYAQMSGYIADGPLMTQGGSQHEILHNIVRDANISKKGKLPQLNALLSYSSVGEACGGHLSVAKNKSTGKFELLYNGSYTKDFDGNVRMSNGNPVSDVPRSPFRSQIESHTVAQSDKSDATGMGGAMAQKMQKIFSTAGYGGFGLRISGPITQSYLDAKQNVTKCGNNLKIGKFVLDGVSKFMGYEEFTDEAMKGADKTQVFRGQYTPSREAGRKGTVPKPLTVQECVSQLDNFIQVMGHPGFTKIDRAVAEAVLSRYESEEPVKAKGKEKETRSVVRDPVRQADSTGDMTYAIMYGSNFVQHVAYMAETGRGLFDGSMAFSDTVDAARLRQRTARGQEGVTEDMIKLAEDSIASRPAVGLGGIGREEAKQVIRERSSALSAALSEEEAKGVLAEYSVQAPAPDGSEDCKGAHDDMEAYLASRKEQERGDGGDEREAGPGTGPDDDVFG